MITKNYHTHTYRCKHATGDVDDYCRAAIAHGLTLLGISDHAALPDNRWDDIRMHFSELPAYCRSIDQARRRFPKLTVLKSMECEYMNAYDAFYREELLGRLGFDYLIGAAHFFPQAGQWIGVYGGVTNAHALRLHAAHFIESMESGLFAFMAHPDLFGNSYLVWDADAEACSRDILEAAAALHMPLEINGYGLIKTPVDTPTGRRPMYPWEPFWELAAEYGVEIVVNSDAHAPENIVHDVPGALAIAHKYNLRFADLSYLG